MSIVPNTIKKIGLCLAFATAGLLANCASEEEEQACTVTYRANNGRNVSTYAGEFTQKDCETMNFVFAVASMQPETPEEAGGSETGGPGTPGTGGNNNGTYTEVMIDGNCEFNESTYVNNTLRLRESFHVFRHYAHGERTVENFDAEGRLTNYQTFDFSSADKQEAQNTLGYVNYDRCARGLIN